MATLDTRLVYRELCAIRDTSQAVKSLLRDVLERIEKNPSSFPLLEDVPQNIAERPNLFLRKASIRTHKHNFRLVFAHWTFPDHPGHQDHVDILLAFPRKYGYKIDWAW